MIFYKTFFYFKDAMSNEMHNREYIVFEVLPTSWLNHHMSCVNCGNLVIQLKSLVCYDEYHRCYKYLRNGFDSDSVHINLSGQYSYRCTYCGMRFGKTFDENFVYVIPGKLVLSNDYFD